MIGVYLKKIRKERGINQRDLAKAAGITGGYLSMIERTGQVPSDAALDGLAAALGIDQSVLYAKAGNVGALIVRLTRENTEAKIKLLQAVDVLPAPAVAELVECILDLRKKWGV